MNIQKFISIFLVFFTISSTFAEGENDPRVFQYDVKHYDLTISFNVQKKSFTGSVRVLGRGNPNLKECVLSCSNETLMIDSVLVENKKTRFSHTNNHLIVDLSRSDSFNVTVYFQGKAVFQGQWESGGVYIKNVRGSGRIATISQPFFARTWWPCKDVPSDKATATITVTVPKPLIAVSNGLLRKTFDDDLTSTFVWESTYPIATYLIAISAAEYREFQQEYVALDNTRMKIVYYVFPESYENAKKDFEIVPSILKYFASTFCEYPFVREKFGFVQVIGNLTMENQTLCSIAEDMITGDGSHGNTIVHEVAHQWWGNFITPKSWHHTWLSEGFATYAEALFLEHRKGKEVYHQYMDVLMSAPLGTFSGSVIGQSDTEFWDSFHHRVYAKGAIVLHMLRGVVGDEKFFKIMKRYLNDSRLQKEGVETSDFINLCENEHGKSLRWFFDQWVYAVTDSLDRPVYSFKWENFRNESGYIVSIKLDQVGENNIIYKMPFLVLIRGNSKSYHRTFIDSLRHQQFQFNVPEKPLEVILDPENWVFKHVIEEKN